MNFVNTCKSDTKNYTILNSYSMDGFDLKNYRTQLGLSQIEIEEATGIPQPSLARYEKSGKINAADRLAILEAFFKSKGISVVSNVLKSPRTEYKVTHKSKDMEAKVLGAIDYPLEPGDEPIQLGDGRWAKAIPLVREYAYGSYSGGWKDPEFLDELPKHVAIFDHKPHSQYFAFEVLGRSMENFTSREMALQSYPEGSKVTARLLDQYHYEKNKLHLHKWNDFVIVRDRDIIIKRIIKHDVERGIITCHSLNPDKEEYPDFEVHLSEVRQILNVIPNV